MAEYLIQDTTLNGIANKIRVLSGAEETMTPAEMVDTLDGIVTLESGTADATAVASDIASGKTAYVNGEKVTGSIYNVTSGSSILTDGDIHSVVDDYLRVVSDSMTTDRVFRTGSKIRVDVPMSDFGNATSSEVANGKTFTSATGLKVTGTGEMASDLAEELATQDSLIAQIATALEGKTGASAPSLKCFASFIGGADFKLEDVNGNTILQNEIYDVENFDLSEYVGELIIMTVYVSADINIDISDYGVSFPLSTTDIVTYGLASGTYAFVVPNHDIVLNFTEA